MSIDIINIRNQFPILKQKIYGKPLIYLDSAASTQKVVDVLLAERRLTIDYYGNIHRAAHFMADKATTDFEAVRTQVADFIGAENKEEIIFTKGSTESINLVAFSFGEAFIGDPEMKLLYRKWSTIPISCPGNCLHNGKMQRWSCFLLTKTAN
jgi:cysteine desulfurase / selenocysteine lyase